MTMIKMVKNRTTQISLIWLTIIIITAASISDNIPRIANLDCLNDCESKVFCAWDVVDSNSNCSEEFTFSYQDFTGKKEKCPDLRNEQFGGIVVPNKCICNIPTSWSYCLGDYEIEVESRGQTVGNKRIQLRNTVKPKTPSNVRVNFTEEINGEVRWDTGYALATMKEYLHYHVQIICQHTRNVALQDFLKHMTTVYYFNKKQLKRGELYVVRVRAQPVEGLQGTWSEWSSEAKWTNDYSLTLLDHMKVIIPTTGIVMLFLIMVIYVCLTRCKKKWWDTIPNPAKSTIVKKKRIEKRGLIPDRKCATKKSCGSFFSRLVKAHKSKCDQLTQQNTVRQYVISIVNSDCKKFMFEPKNEDIERCVEMHPKMDDENNPLQEGKPEDKDVDHPFEEDISIANMFFAILHDSSNKKVNTFENLNLGTFECPALMDSFGKEETQQSNLNVSGHWKLGHHNCDSDDSSLDSSSDIDVVKMPCFDQWPDNAIDSILYTPQASIKDCSYLSKGGPLASPDYNSFASAVSEARKDFIIDITKRFCLDNISKSTVLGNTNINEQQLCPKGILYYNTKHFCSHINEDSFQTNIKPKSRQIILQCHGTKTDPTSLCQVSGYQSFEQAVQENEPEVACHISGYKSFDQTVKEGDQTSMSEVNDYQSFNHAVQENRPRFGCYISGYKGFDQTVQEGDEASVCEVNGYQSFDQAVEESETSRSTNRSILDSGYKSFESLLCQNYDDPKNNGYTCDNDPLRDSHCENNTKFDKSQEYRLLSSGLMEHRYSEFVKTTKINYPSSSDKSFNALKISVGTNLNSDMALKHEGIPLALTFDICEHLRNQENMHGHKVSLNSLEMGTIPMNEAIFPCHLDTASLSQEQLMINKNHTFHKCPSTTYTFENTSFLKPLYDLDITDSSETTEHLLIQQSSLDKDGNSYMKIK